MLECSGRSSHEECDLKTVKRFRSALKTIEVRDADNQRTGKLDQELWVEDWPLCDRCFRGSTKECNLCKNIFWTSEGSHTQYPELCFLCGCDQAKVMLGEA